MIPIFIKRAHILADYLEGFIDTKKTVDMQTQFQKLTFDVIGLVAVGTDFGSQTNESNPYENAWEVVLHQLMFQFYFPLPKWIWPFLRFIPNVNDFYRSITLDRKSVV